MSKSKSIRLVGQLLVNSTLGLIILLFSVLILNVVLEYLDYQPTGFLIGKSSEVRADPLFKYSFFAHCFTAPIALLISAFQIQSWLRKKNIAIHTWLGRMYIFLVLVIAAPSGFILGYYSEPAFCFMLLAILWWLFTYKGYKTIRNGMLLAHREWMFRGVMLILAAITLRVYLSLYTVVFEEAAGSFEYHVIAWLSWIPNLLLAELLIWIKRQKNDR